MFWFLMFPYYSRRIYYPKLRNPDAQNIVASENHGKQRKSSDHWKTIKNVVFEKKMTRDDAKTKWLTEIQVLTKGFTSYKIRYKSLRKTKQHS